ncbi:MAG TPA: FtsX-like permease family protein, partial [Blastocatellia bacterium]|nr:FtsX-like permease family protein [Blastocatellia bacterium]
GVVLINETMARRYWPGHDPIGQRLEIGYSRKELEIIGMVGDVRQLRLDAEVKPEVYVSFNQTPWTFMTFVIKTAGDPSSLASTVRGQVGIVDKDIPVYSIATMQQRMSDSVAKRRFNMLLVGSFGFLALVLAGVGIYGVISYSVAQRTHEIGLRMALGADRRDIFRLIVGQGIVLTIIGIGIGLIGSFALTRLISTLLFGVTATDTLTFAGVSLLLSSVALAACYVPARRATRVDPMVALRYE